MSDPQINQTREFLRMFNNLGELCFNQCVHSFYERTINKDEEKCVDSCLTKYSALTNHVTRVFMEIQPKITERKIKEQADLEALYEKKLAEAAQANKSEEAPANAESAAS